MNGKEFSDTAKKRAAKQNGTQSKATGHGKKVFGSKTAKTSHKGSNKVKLQ